MKEKILLDLGSSGIYNTLGGGPLGFSYHLFVDKGITRGDYRISNSRYSPKQDLRTVLDWERNFKKIIEEVKKGRCSYIMLDKAFGEEKAHFGDVERGLNLAKKTKRIMESIYPKTNIKTIAGDIKEIPFESEVIDYVIFKNRDCWEEEEKAFKEVYRILKPEGFLFENYHWDSEMPSDDLFTKINKVKGQRLFECYKKKV